MDASISGSGGGGGGSGGAGGFMRNVARDNGERFVFRRAARGGTPASSRLLRYAAAGDDEDDDSNYVSVAFVGFAVFRLVGVTEELCKFWGSGLCGREQALLHAFLLHLL